MKARHADARQPQDSQHTRKVLEQGRAQADNQDGYDFEEVADDVRIKVGAQASDSNCSNQLIKHKTSFNQPVTATASSAVGFTGSHSVATEKVLHIHRISQYIPSTLLYQFALCAQRPHIVYTVDCVLLHRTSRTNKIADCS